SAEKKGNAGSRRERASSTSASESSPSSRNWRSVCRQVTAFRNSGFHPALLFFLSGFLGDALSHRKRSEGGRLATPVVQTPVRTGSTKIGAIPAASIVRAQSS